MDTLLQDLRFALRSLRRTPGFALTVVVMMALGIGVNAMIYSVLRAILFSDLPFAEPDRIVSVDAYSSRHPDEHMSMSLPDSRDLIAQARTLSAVGLWTETSAYLAAGDVPTRLAATMSNDGLLRALGVQPAMGRWFTPEECLTGANLTTVAIGHKVWQEQFKSDPNVLGKTLTMNGRVRTIVGVMPEGFRFPETHDIFIPFPMNDTSDSRGAHYLQVVARMNPGVSMKSVNAELAQIAAGLAKEFVPTNKNVTFRAETLREDMISDVRPMLLILAIAVTFVLLIACANVANLLLARANSRVRELGVRLAMGATRGRVVRQLLTESVLLAVSGGVLGVLLGEWGMRVTIASIPIELPYWMHFQLDAKVVAIVVVVSVVSGIAFGLAPAWQVTSGDLLTPLREGTPGGGDTRARRRMRNTLVVAEVALAVLLLIGSGLMVRSFLRMQEQKHALRADGVLTGTVTLPVAMYEDEAKRVAFFQEWRHALEGLSGVQSVGGVLNLHLGRNNWSMSVQREGIDPPKSPEMPIVAYNVITPGYLKTVGLTLLRGRDITEADGEDGARVMILNESAAKKLWPKEDALGKRLRFDDKVEYSTVVGITADVSQHYKSSRERMAEAMVPYKQWKGQTLTWTIRTTGDPAALAPAVRALLRTRAPSLPFYNVRSLNEQFSRNMWEPRLYAQLLGVFSVLALIIAALGIYGVMAYSVAQRTREIGIRMALGAARADVQRLVVGQATKLTLAGLGLGLALSFALTRFMASQLFGIRPDDPPTFGTVAVVLAASAVLAAWLPTARAVRVDPVVALRHE